MFRILKCGILNVTCRLIEHVQCDVKMTLLLEYKFIDLLNTYIKQLGLEGLLYMGSQIILEKCKSQNATVQT